MSGRGKNLSIVEKAPERITADELAMLKEFKAMRDRAAEQSRVADAVYMTTFGYICRAHGMADGDTIDLDTGAIVRVAPEPATPVEPMGESPAIETGD